MSTRKTRLNTDSPTPNSGSESTPSTPNAAVQKRLTRKMLDTKTPSSTAAPEDAVSTVAAATTSSPLTVATEVLKKQAKVEQASPTRKRSLIKTSSKDDLVATAAVVVKPNEEVPDKKESTIDDVVDPSKRTRRSLIEKRIMPRGTPRKVRKSLPVVLQKDIILKRRGVGRPCLSADRKKSARIVKEVPLRSGRARKKEGVVVPVAAATDKVVRAIRKRSRAADKADETTEAEDDEDADSTRASKIIKQESPDDDMTSAMSDLESDSGHRSNSVSKCSDVSSNMDTPLHLLKEETVMVKEEPKDILSDVEEDEDDTAPVDSHTNEDSERPADDAKLIGSVDAKPDIIDDALLDAAPVLIAEEPMPVTKSTSSISLNQNDGVSDAADDSKSVSSRISQKTPPLTVSSTRPKRALVRPKFSVPTVAAVAPVVDEPLPETSLPDTQIAEISLALTDVAKCENTTITDVPIAEPIKKNESDIEEETCKQELVEPIENKFKKQSDDIQTETEPIKSTSLALAPPAQIIPSSEAELEPKTNAIELTPPKTPPTKSPSPVLASDAVSTISVKSFYGQPDFLENNPGIEDDPKLRDMVKEHAVVDDVLVKVSTDDLNKEMVEEIKQLAKTDLANNVKVKLASTSEKKLVDMEVTESACLTASTVDTKVAHAVTIDQEQDVHMAEPDDKENLVKSVQVAASSPNRAPLLEHSIEAQDIPSESPETIRQKENHFLKLGLLTHHAAKIEKQKRRESMASNPSKSTGKKSAEYTGTLKTIIKLNRPSTGSDSGGKGKKTGRQSGALKMTLHKARGKGGAASATASSSGASGGDAAAHAPDEETYYTIQTEAGESADAVPVHDGPSITTAACADTVGTKEAEALLVIPEKASSFRIHPDKLCQDQCFYCGGKFGLFDTPCHVAGIKSLERQRKILENEEKLTVDNCLCDACFRHVDRRANCPMYKKRTSNVVSTASSEYSKMLKDSMAAGSSKTNSGDEAAASGDASSQPAGTDGTVAVALPSHMCHVVGCASVSAHSIRRKWLMKMRRQIGKLLPLSPEACTIGGAGMLAICSEHYNVIGHLMVCTLCKRKLVRNHIYYINQDVAKLEQLLADVGINVTIGTSPVVCKLCRYFSNLLLKPPDKPPKTAFVKEYRRRLLQFYNVDAMEDTDESQPTSDQLNSQQSQQPHDLRVHPDNPNPSKRRSNAKRQRKSLRNEDSHSLLSSVDSNAAEDEDLSPSSQSPAVPVACNAETNISDMTAKILADYEQSQSISIMPRAKNAVPVPKAQVILVETGDTQHTKEDLSALRANPNISMRELFPGEEEMGLHVNVPFGTVGAQRTPEGWTKCQTTIQYDEPTRNLWEELQKPYGNQSSFLRHLILLEKYFRNGDLVISPNAGCSAVNYAGSVQQRLQSYDNKIDSDTTAASSISMLASSLFANGLQTPNSSISITPTSNSKTKLKANAPEAASTSLLKTKRNSSDNKPKDKGANPPELISINTANKQPTLVATLNSSTSNSSPSLSASSSPTNLTTAKAPKAHSLLIPQHAPQAAAKKQSNPKAAPTETSTKPGTDATTQAPVIRLPDVLTPAERLESKMWRPTLMPVSAGPPALNGQLYQTADGRKLPNLVQVQSGGNPYLISIHDYNRMCILRRERLLRDQMMQLHQQQPGGSMGGGGATTSAAGKPTSLIHPLQSSTPKSSGSGAKSKSALNNHAGGYASAQGKVQIPNKILEQNSLIPLHSAGGGSSGSKGVGGALDSLLKVRKPNPTSLLKQNNSTKSNAASSSSSNIISITSTPSIAAILGVSTPPSSVHQQQQQQQNQQMLQTQQFIQQQFLQQQLAYQQMASGSRGGSQHITPNVTATLSGSWPMESMLKTSHGGMTGGPELSSLSNMWSWAESLNKSGGGDGGSGSAAGSSGAMDASLLSKIPKSLTVIPQQKDRRSFSGKAPTGDGNRSS